MTRHTGHSVTAVTPAERLEIRSRALPTTHQDVTVPGVVRGLCFRA